MNSQNDVTSQKQVEITNGLKAANTFLKSISTTIDKNGVLVTVNGEGFILALQLSEPLNEAELANILMKNINEAIQQNKAKILKTALQGLPK